MKLEMIGLNHTTAVLATRDRAAIGPERMGEVVERLRGVQHVEGVVILSTCNRVEIYFSPSYHFTDDLLRELFAEVCSLTADEAAQAYIYRDDHAARHLFRVASGLDSQLLGETQILVQVKGAYQSALELASSNAFLNRVFLRAIECGKLVRHRTAISQGAVSVAYAAVDLAMRVFGNLERHNVLLVGAGETVRLASKYLADAGAKSWRVSNRTRANADALAGILGGAVTHFPPVEEDIAWADVIVCATSSPDAVITADLARKALLRRKDPSVILDLAVPRDVEPSLTNTENAYVYSVDDFQELVETNLRARQKEAIRAEKLIEKQVEEFVEWYRENRIAPTIQQLQEVLEGIRSTEVENNARRFCSDDREQVEKFSKSLIQKVTSLIIANMKQARVDGKDLSLAQAVSQAFAPPDGGDVKDVIEKLNHELSH
jgi:glutamyl-tRNA reductase